MPYLKSESDFNFAINSVSDFDSVFKSDSASESDSSSEFMNLGICIFSLYTYTLLNKPVDNFSFQFS